MVIEGRNSIREAIAAGTAIGRLFVQKGLHGMEDIVDRAKSQGARVVFCDKRELDKLSDSGAHRGVIAVVEDYKYSTLDDIRALASAKGEKLFLLILDGIEDPHNLGSILRVAECSGAHGIVIPKRRAVGVNGTVVKVSSGAAQHVKVAAVNNINDTIRALKQDFVNVYCADMQGGAMYDTDMTGDTAIVIGSEGFGVKSLTASLCDKAISIPQSGKVNSLNASVACGILCYELIRQRLKR
ncbi:MAG: 23S rRNA (guanosine(2251)-2'-O)-methyltransferase RlmB [Clostridia bacterium]|nr:23S rRNA (guanosine(2251)-2'-O)-methyltransferase RlmB [Clostridia bacterium]